MESLSGVSSLKTKRAIETVDILTWFVTKRMASIQGVFMQLVTFIPTSAVALEWNPN